MYETVISADNKHIEWLEELSRTLGEKLKGRAVTSVSMGRNVSRLGIGGDGRYSRSISRDVEQAVVALLTGTVKREYISGRLESVVLPPVQKKLLCHAMTAFDRATESEIICENLTMGKTLNIEGLLIFRFGEVEERWAEICRMATEHASYLADDETLNELLRYLIEAACESERRAEIFKLGGKYRMVVYDRGSSVEKVFDVFDDMLCRLIDYAPSETIVSGFDYDESFMKLHAIFDVKCNNFG